MDRAILGARNKGGRKVRNGGLPVAARKLLVQQANKRTEILSLCSGLPSSHIIGDSTFSLVHNTSSTTDQDVKTWMLDITRKNVKQLYVDAGWGWSDEQKGSELWHKAAHYLLVRNEATQELVAFTNFRFDMDYGSHVLYCYELQVSSSIQGGGIGAWLMGLLLSIASGANMSKVILTVGRNNPRALKFYFEMGYRVDETSPASLKDVSSGTYLILSCGSKQQDMKTNMTKKNNKNRDPNTGGPV